MKNLILVMVALVSLSLSAQAGITKVYVGVEDGQFIFGLAGKVIDRKNGALNYDFRNMLAKSAETKNGVEYPAMPAQSKTMVGIASLSGQAIQQNLYAFGWESTRVNALDGNNQSFSKTSVEAKTGSGYYLLYE